MKVGPAVGGCLLAADVLFDVVKYTCTYSEIHENPRFSGILASLSSQVSRYLVFEVIVSFTSVDSDIVK